MNKGDKVYTLRFCTVTIANNRTQGNVGGSLSDEGITVQSLIDRYNHADFNRRWDSYEIAGWILSDAKATEFRLDAIEYFNKFDAQKYSAAQAEEIRQLMKTALENRAPDMDIANRKEWEQ